MEEYDCLFKIVIIGESGVGKSAIINQYTKNFFSDTYVSTIGVDFQFKEVEHEGKKIKLQIWDTAGQERFRTITNSYYRHSNGILLVYDVTNMETFANVEKWINEIYKFVPQDIPILLIGNKIDLESIRVISTNEGLLLSKKYNCEFVEVSAKEYSSIDKAMKIMIPKLFNRVVVLDVQRKNDVNKKIDLNSKGKKIIKDEPYCSC